MLTLFTMLLPVLLMMLSSAVDLLLPRLLLGEPLRRPLLARLAAGGLVGSLPVHRAIVKE